MPSKAGYTQVRVKNNVHARLVSMRATLIATRAKMAEAGKPWLDGDISLSDVIQTLLWREDEKAMRAKSSRQRRQNAEQMVQ